MSNPKKGMQPNHEPEVVAVLGAGPSGLAAAQYLCQRGKKKVIVIDQADRCGGTHRSVNIGPYTFDSGSIFFEQRHPMFEMYDGLKEQCPAVTRVQGRIIPDGTVHRYPFEPREAMSWPLGKKTKAFLDLLVQRILRKSPVNAEEMCVSVLGRTIYTETGLSRYMERLNHLDPKQLDVLFCKRRMSFVMRQSKLSSLVKSVFRNLVGKTARPVKKASLLVRPVEGFDALYDRIQESLTKQGARFLLNTKVEGIEKDDAGFQVRTSDGVEYADELVGAMPINSLHKFIFGQDTELESLDLITLFVSVSELKGFDGNVLFNFGAKGQWKRITVYSRIYGQKNNREYFAVEVTCLGGVLPEAADVFEAFRKDVSELALFADDLSLEGYDIIHEAYPLYRLGCEVHANKAIARLEEFGVQMVGRQGRFEYLPISAEVISKTQEQMSISDIPSS